MRTNSIGMAVVTGLLSFTPPACNSNYRANFNVGADFAQAEARRIISVCEIDGQPVTACLESSSGQDVCRSQLDAAYAGCRERFAKIINTGRLDDK